MPTLISGEISIRVVRSKNFLEHKPIHRGILSPCQVWWVHNTQAQVAAFDGVHENILEHSCRNRTINKCWLCCKKKIIFAWKLEFRENKQAKFENSKINWEFALNEAITRNLSFIKDALVSRWRRRRRRLDVLASIVGEKGVGKLDWYSANWGWDKFFPFIAITKA